jgi:hypothetical protein
MKKTFIFAMLLVAANAMATGEQTGEMVADNATQPVDSLKTVELQGVQVRSTRASKRRQWHSLTWIASRLNV